MSSPSGDLEGQSISFPKPDERNEFEESLPRSTIGQIQNSDEDIKYSRPARPQALRQPDSTHRASFETTDFATRRRKQCKIRACRNDLEESSIVASWHRQTEKTQTTTTPLGRYVDAKDVADIDSVKKRFRACLAYARGLRKATLGLESAGLVDKIITILVYDSARGVVVISPIHTVEVTHIFGSISDLVEENIGAFKPKPPWEFEDFAAFMGWKLRCWNDLHTSGLSLVTSSEGFELGGHHRLGYSSKDLPYLVELAEFSLQLFDLALIAHISAHVSQDESSILHPNSPGIALPLHHSASSPKQGSLLLEERRLACLHELTGSRRVWVFRRPNEIIHEPLFVSTSVEHFALIWGPLWRVPSESGSGFQQYNVGGGVITPCKYEEGSQPRPAHDERLCHWARIDNRDGVPASGDLDDIADLHVSPSIINASAREHEAFTGKERLLIGAYQSPKLRWYRCDCSITQFRDDMRGSHLLFPLWSRGMFYYVDARQAGISAGTHGISVTGTATWKTDKGQTMKEGFLEEWENNPQTWSPWELVDFRGVLVSACTMNARRVRLVDLLATDSLLSLIARVRWSDKRRHQDTGEWYSRCHEGLTAALKSGDPFAVIRLWEAHPQWQQDLGNALLACIRALSATGYDRPRKVFNVLWVPQTSARLLRLVLHPDKHNWVRMLEESEDSMTMAVLVEDCLAPNRTFGHARCCRQQDLSSILETAIQVNSRLTHEGLRLVRASELRDPPPWRTADRDWRYIWDVEGQEKDSFFWISSTQRLKVVQPLTPSHLFVRSSQSISEMARAVLRLKPSKRETDWEYVTDESDDESTTVRPIPVHVS